MVLANFVNLNVCECFGGDYYYLAWDGGNNFGRFELENWEDGFSPEELPAK